MIFLLSFPGNHNEDQGQYHSYGKRNHRYCGCDSSVPAGKFYKKHGKRFKSSTGYEPCECIFGKYRGKNKETSAD